MNSTYLRHVDRLDEKGTAMEDQQYSTSGAAPAPSDVLRLILGAQEIKRLERVSRATRVRELTVKLGELVHAMDDRQRSGFVELVGLVRAEHTEACTAQTESMEVQSAQDVLLTVRRDLEKLQSANAKMHAIALHLQESQARAVAPHKSSSAIVGTFSKWFMRAPANKG